MFVRDKKRREREWKKNYDNINVCAANTFLRFAEWTKFVSSHITFYGALIRLIVTFTSEEKKVFRLSSFTMPVPSGKAAAAAAHTILTYFINFLVFVSGIVDTQARSAYSHGWHSGLYVRSTVSGKWQQIFRFVCTLGASESSPAPIMISKVPANNFNNFHFSLFRSFFSHVRLHSPIAIFSQVNRPQNSSVWTLQIKYPQLRDAGIYECQINSEPKISLSYTLNVIGESI